MAAGSADIFARAKLDINQDDADTIYSLGTESGQRFTDCGVGTPDHGGLIQFKSADTDVQDELRKKDEDIYTNSMDG
jgi:hypothetical protein